MANRPDRRDLFRKRPEAANRSTLHEFVESIDSTIERISSASINEIDGLIAELRSIRDFLRTETGRVEREVAGYVAEVQAATTSTKAMANGLAHWKPDRSNSR